MGYQMIYETYKQPQSAVHTFRLRTMIAVCFLIFSFIVRTFWGPGVEILREAFIPGDPTATQMAFETFLANLQKGENIQVALEVFCESVLNAGY